MTLFEYDENEGVWPLCGVDEAGRGPLAGDVYAAAVVLPRGVVIDGLNDSKKLTPQKRDLLYEQIREKAAGYSIATATVAEIEEYNILGATFLAMRRAVEGLPFVPRLALVDGNRNPGLHIHTRLVVKGDATSASVAAASILAKVARDRYMEQMDRDYPQYQFSRHKGYGTALHYEMLARYGPSPVHRLSFLQKSGGRSGRAARAGVLGEETAAKLLEQSGYCIEARNYRSPYGELDVVARNEQTLVFVEVKTRTEDAAIPAREAVTAVKRKKLVQTASLYIQETGTSIQPRFDVIEVYLTDEDSPKVKDVNWIENAFDGGDTDEYF